MARLRVVELASKIDVSPSRPHYCANRSHTSVVLSDVMTDPPKFAFLKAYAKATTEL